MSTKGEDDAISSLEGYTRYASSRSTAVEPVKPEYSETPIMLSKVHSSQVQGTGIEMERLRTMRLEQTYSETRIVDFVRVRLKMLIWKSTIGLTFLAQKRP